MERDLHPKIDPGFADRIAKVSKFELWIAGRIHSHDRATTPPEHFINAEIFKMPAVAEIDEILLVVGQPE